MKRASVVLLLALIGARPLAAESLEPPPEAREGEDYEAEDSDTLSSGEVEVDFGAAGRGGGPMRRRQHLRLSGEELSAGVREGPGDPLAGADVRLRALGGTLAAGRLAPRWGRGVVIGGSGEPWTRTTLERDDALSRGRTGEGWTYRRGEQRSIAVLGGRFARRDLAGVSVAHGPVGLAAIASPRLQRTGSARSVSARAAQYSTWCLAGDVSAELAMDRRGRWRAEAAGTREAGDWRLALGARGGAEGFQPLAAPSRSGPARAVSAALDRERGPIPLSGRLALWRFAPAVSGARATLELRPRVAQHGQLVVGFEEQHGTRRAPVDGVSAERGLRQGLWGEWRGTRGPLALGLRHETWGAEPWVRASVRAVSTVRVELALPVGATARLTHSVYRVRTGESLYLPEPGIDRLVLRAVTGAGERSRLEVSVPAARGTIRAALDLSLVEEKLPRAQWTLDWIRRTRTR